MKMTKTQIVYSMCETWLPGFSNLHEQEKEYIYNKMFEVYIKNIEPNMTSKEENNGYVTIGKLLGILDEYDKRFYAIEHRLDIIEIPKPMMTTTGTIGSAGDWGSGSMGAGSNGGSGYTAKTGESKYTQEQLKEWSGIRFNDPSERR